MNKKQEVIQFIINYDNERYLEECIYYIHKLHVPYGYVVDIMSIRDADTLEEAYNTAMKENDAKYKVYMDQRTFVIHAWFLYEILNIFHNNSSVGMLGIYGRNGCDETGDRGRFLLWGEDGINEINMQRDKCPEKVNWINPMLIVTQYDIEWKNVEQHNVAMSELGYETIIPYQKQAWVVYDCGMEETVEDEDKEEYRLLLRRVENCHERKGIDRVKKLLTEGNLRYEEHIKEVERQAFAHTITGYLWEDGLLCRKNSSRDMIPDGKIWMGDKMKNEMNVVIAFNHKYAVYAQVMLQSLYENNSFCNITVYILQSDLTVADQLAMAEQAEKFDNKVVFIDFAKEMFPEGLKVTQEWSLEMYFRLYMVDVLPKDVQRVLYLDVDVIVHQPIYELYFMDMQEHDMIVCRDFGQVLQEGFSDKRKELFAHVDKEEFIYFNSGMMLVDVSRLQNKIHGCDYIEIADKKASELFAPDQDILNLMHWESVGFVDEYRYDFFNACLKGLKAEEVNQYVSIIHYAGPKPWMPIDLSIHAHRIWWEYAVRTQGAESLVYHKLLQMNEENQALKGVLDKAKYCMHVPYMSCEVEGIKYINTSTDLTIIRNMYNTGENWSKKEIHKFFELSEKYYGTKELQKEDIFLDIGANIGTTAIYVHKEKAPGIKVIAFEPVKDNIKMFKANCILNEISEDGIVLVEKAVSNRIEHNIISKNFINPGASHIVYDKNMADFNTESVESITLDEYIKTNRIQIDKIKYIWIDVEGYEGFVLDGACKLLTDTKIPMLMEFVPKYLKRQGSYELLLNSLQLYYRFFVCLDEYDENTEPKLRVTNTLGDFGAALGDGQTDIFLIK